ncbi:hypothetical protein NEICINOT_03007 [Neisseria cinerea ATCC 14685]|uniref:Uncharacterized protein n=1 Tax=Neisseria cinerea ATCC 14685 TaxID=546262 RepID=D0W045_NEICI|nr:hypothetical protein NEICINOT_03007 [Neisseria cinerea ATCC 14685]
MNSIEIFLGGALWHFNRFGRQGQKYRLKGAWGKMPFERGIILLKCAYRIKFENQDV